MDATSSVASVSVPQFRNLQFVRLMRGLWWLVFGISLFLLIASLPHIWQTFQSGPTSIDMPSAELATYQAAFFEGLEILHIPVAVYVAFKLTLRFIILLIFWGMAFVIFRLRFQERIGMQAAFCFLALGTSMVVFILNEPVTYDIPLLDGLFLVGGLVIAIIAWGSLYMFLPLYPDGRFVPRWIFVIPLVWLSTVIIDIVAPNSPLSNENWSPIISLLFSLIVFGGSLGAQVYRYWRVSTPLQRQQTKWFIYALTIFVAVTTIPFFVQLDRQQPLQAVLADFMYALFDTTAIFLPLAVGIAILRYRLWDIDIVINKSLVYGSVAALAIVTFFGVLLGLQIIIGQQQPLIALLIAGGFSAAIFRPVTNRAQNLVDRYIYRLNFNLNELNAAQRKYQITNPGALSGKTVDGYEVRNVIGQGGMGEVYQGFSNGQTVAIKTMLPKIAQEPDMRTRFQREAQAGMQLDHPHITKVYAHGEMDGTPYLVMDYIEGQDLSQMLKTGGKLDEETTARMMQDICAALDAAHSKGFIHRDLKPSNIMIRPNGEAVLMDFGVTKMTNASTSLTGTGAIGTIDYMAPEQIAAAREVDKRADIYALGVMLYEMLTGEKPFKGSAAQILFAHLQQPPPDPTDINPAIPAKIADAIERAMSKKPEERFQSAGELAATLNG